jgi:hypothetical protein
MSRQPGQFAAEAEGTGRARLVQGADFDAPMRQIGRVMGTIVGFLLRLVPAGGETLGGMMPAARAPKSEFVRRRDQLKTQVEALDRELGRVHALITRGALPGAGASHGGLTVEGQVARARELRERISEKQTELLRVERHVDRERRLHSKPRVRTKKRAKSLAPRGPGAKERKALERQRHAVFRVLETAPFRDRTERVLVERIAAGLFYEDLVYRRQSTLELRRVASVAAVRLLTT